MKRHPVSSIWLEPRVKAREELEQTLAAGLSRAPERPVQIFFRADDVAVPGERIERLLMLFKKHQTPLALAVVPAWLTPARWQYLVDLAGDDPDLWCWHQHGWRHHNHEPQGKKQEFGPHRAPAGIRRDIVRGRRRLEMLMGHAFYPAFTPPWNRCNRMALETLQDLGYHAVSRSVGSLPPPPPSLNDFQVGTDLHTLKEPDPEKGWRQLWSTLENGLSSGRCGVMIHHQRMNGHAFRFLDLMLSVVKNNNGLRPAHLGHFHAAAQERSKPLGRNP